MHTRTSQPGAKGAYSNPYHIWFSYAFAFSPPETILPQMDQNECFNLNIFLDQTYIILNQLMDLTLMTNFLDSKDDAHNVSGTAAAIFLIIS